jgi:hypothetical protein
MDNPMMMNKEVPKKHRKETPTVIRIPSRTSEEFTSQLQADIQLFDRFTGIQDHGQFLENIFDFFKVCHSSGYTVPKAGRGMMQSWMLWMEVMS